MLQDGYQRCDILQLAAEVWGPGPSALSRLKQLEEERVRLRRDGGLVAKQSYVTGYAIKKRSPSCGTKRSMCRLLSSVSDAVLPIQ